MTTYEIPFTQYHLPNGRKSREIFEHNDPSIDAKVKALINDGYVFECEILSTGEVSITTAKDGEDKDLFNAIVANGPKVSEAVFSIVESAYSDRFGETQP